MRLVISYGMTLMKIAEMVNVPLTSDLTCSTTSPAEGVSLQPVTSTGVPGGALWICFSCSLNIARTLHTHLPATRIAPRWRLPLWIITVAIGLEKGETLNDIKI